MTLSPTSQLENLMSLVKGILKTAIVIKLAEVAQRELSKPENQRKIKEGIRKFQEAARPRS